MSTWKDVLNVPGEDPVYEGITEHHDDGQLERVAFTHFGTLVDVVPLNPDALLLVLGEVLAAVAEGHTRQ